MKSFNLYTGQLCQGGYRLHSRKVALALSFICCGLGQIYNGQITKGIDFIIIYAMLIAATFSSIVWLRIVGFSILPFMWIIGMADAYMDRDKFIAPKKWLLIVLPAIIVSLFVLWFQVFFTVDTHSETNAQIAEVLSEEENTSSDFFSIQTGNFKDIANAEELRDRLLYKGYSARIEDPTSNDGIWYRVLIGKYQNREDAAILARELREREQVFYMIVRCYAKEHK